MLGDAVVGWSGFFFSSRRRHTRCSRDWSSDVCSSDLLSVAAETGRNIVSDNLEDAADGVVGLENGVHFGFHFVLGGGIRAAQRGIQIRADGANVLPGGGTLQTDVAYLEGVAGDFRAEFLQEDFGKRAGRDARGGFAGRGPLENIARDVI